MELPTFLEPSLFKGRDAPSRVNKIECRELSLYQDPLIKKWEEKVGKGLGGNRGTGFQERDCGKLYQGLSRRVAKSSL